MADLVPSPPLPPRSLLETIPGLKQVGLLAGVAAAVAAAIWLVIWSQGQNYTVLYGQLSERESGQVMDALTAAGIPATVGPTETLRSDMKASLPVDSELIPVG